MVRRVRGSFHARCGAEENPAITSKNYLSYSDEKWNFAEILLSVLEENIKKTPEKIFKKNGFRREDVLFFATMGDGDYIEEMIETSVKMFHVKETLEAYGLTE